MSRAALVAAARLADPLGALPIPEGGDASEVIDLLRKNKVPLVGLDASRAGAGRITGSDAWRRAVDEEAAMRRAQAVEVEEVVSNLARSGIESILFKSPGPLPYRSSNLDLLVRPEHLPAACRILRESGHQLLPHYREENKLLFRRFRSGRHVLCVHLHAAVSWGRVLILRGGEVADRSVPSPDGSFRAASPSDLVLVTLAHALYETDQVRLSDIRNIRIAARSESLSWDAIQARAGAYGWLEGFSTISLILAGVERSLLGETVLPAGVEGACRRRLSKRPLERRYLRSVERRLSAREPVAPFPISKLHAKAQAWIALCRRPDLGPGEPLAELFATAWNLVANRFQLRCRPAAIVSVSGLDGSGKSTAVRALHEALTLCEVPARVVWNRGGFTGPMTRIKSAARAALPGRLPAAAQEAAKTEWLSRPIAGAAFASMIVIEQAVLWCVRARLLRIAGRTLVCDRFAWDTAADLESKLGQGRRAATVAGRLLIALAPRPDLALLLRLTPDEAMRRKPGDASAGRLATAAATMDRLSAGLGIVVIDAMRPEHEVAGEVVDRGLSAVLARFERTGRGGA